VVQELALTCWVIRGVIVTMATLQKDQVIIFILQLNTYVLNKNIENKLYFISGFLTFTEIKSVC